MRHYRDFGVDDRLFKFFTFMALARHRRGIFVITILIFDFNKQGIFVGRGRPLCDSRRVISPNIDPFLYVYFLGLHVDRDHFVIRQKISERKFFNSKITKNCYYYQYIMSAYTSSKV